MSRRFTRRQALQGAGGALAAGIALPALLGTEAAAAATELATVKGWAKDVRIRFFAGGDPGDAFASIVYRGAQYAQADLGSQVQPVFSGWEIEKMLNQLRDAIAAKPDGIAFMGHAGDTAVMPLAKQAHDARILMEYQNVDVPKVRAKYGGGYIGANLEPQGEALGNKAIEMFGLKKGDQTIVFGAWGQPGRYIREQGTVNAFEKAGIKVVKITVQPSAASDPNELTPIVTSALLKNPTTKLICYPGGQQLGVVPVYMAAANKKPGEIISIGFDLSPAIINAFKTGYVQLTADQQPFMQGYLPILSLALQKKFGLTPLSFDTGAGFVTKDNYQSVAVLAKQGLR
jgi:simple sugar transport system substrate-binding protein